MSEDRNGENINYSKNGNNGYAKSNKFGMKPSFAMKPTTLKKPNQYQGPAQTPNKFMNQAMEGNMNSAGHYQEGNNI